MFRNIRIEVIDLDAKKVITQTDVPVVGKEMNEIMIKKYQIKIPRSMYMQVISCIFIIIVLSPALRKDNLLFVFPVIILMSCSLVQIVMLLKKILTKSNELELTDYAIKINHIKVPISQIEKIIIQGYFVQSIGIKLYGSKLVSMDLHFRFKSDEETNIEELKQWAILNKINIANGNIYRWI